MMSSSENEDIFVRLLRRCLQLVIVEEKKKKLSRSLFDISPLHLFGLIQQSAGEEKDLYRDEKFVREKIFGKKKFSTENLIKEKVFAVSKVKLEWRIKKE